MKKGFKKTVSLLLSSLLLAGAISFSAGAAQVKTDVAVGYGVFKACHKSLLVTHVGSQFRQTVERLLYHLLFVVAGNNYR